MAARLMPADQARAGPDSDEPGPRWLYTTRAKRVIYTLLALEVGLVIVFAAAYAPFDLNIYLWGGKEVTHGLQLYQLQSHANWFTYPPFAAVVFTPLAALPNYIVRMAWELATVGALAWSCVLTLKLAGIRPARRLVLAMVAAAFALEPVYHTLFLGQVNLFLLAFVLTDVWRAARGKPAGIGVGLAAAIKLVPAIFILFFLVTRRTKQALTAAATFVVCGLIGYLVDPAASHLYWTKLFRDTSRVSAAYVDNETPYAALVRIMGGTTHVGDWYLIISLIIVGLGMAVAATLARRKDWLGAATVGGVTGLLASPISWSHHWVWIIPALVVLLRGGRASRIAAVCGYILFALAPFWFTPHSHEAGAYGFHGFETLVANSYLIAGLAFLAYMAVMAYRRPGAKTEAASEPATVSTLTSKPEIVDSGLNS
jgi:uncharacterized membrane protein